MKHVPFYPNTKDDLHCVQASYRMILKHFMPDRSYTYKQLDHITGQKKGLWTWPMNGMMYFLSLGFDLVDIEEFDYGRIATEPEEYLKEVYGDEAAREQVLHSDLPRVKRDAAAFAKLNVVDYRLPDINDVSKLLDEGYLVQCLVNSNALNGKTGYVGHSVVVYDYTPKTLLLHDPGLPPMKARRVYHKTFIHAWAYPDEKAKNIAAFRLKR